MNPIIATAENVAAFGALVGARHGAIRIMEFDGVEVFGAIPIMIEGTPELIVCRSPRRPMLVNLMERHWRHTQVYLPMNDKPFVMVLAPPSDAELPAIGTLCAFVFRDGCGIALGRGVWHEFPFALSDDTQFAVILTAECHVGGDRVSEFADDADGPDLQRRSFAQRDGFDVSVAETIS